MITTGAPWPLTLKEKTQWQEAYLHKHLSASSLMKIMPKQDAVTLDKSIYILVKWQFTWPSFCCIVTPKKPAKKRWMNCTKNLSVFKTVCEKSFFLGASDKKKDKSSDKNQRGENKLMFENLSKYIFRSNLWKINQTT